MIRSRTSAISVIAVAIVIRPLASVNLASFGPGINIFWGIPIAHQKGIRLGILHKVLRPRRFQPAA